MNDVKILKLGLLMVPLSLVSMYLWDQNIAWYLDAIFGSSLDKAANKITWLGLADVYFWISSLGYLVAALSEKYFNHKISKQASYKLKKQFQLMFTALLTSGVLVVCLKIIIGRCRPYHSPVFDAFYFKPFSLNWDFQSYPSGHTQVSFTIAAFLIYLWPKFTRYFYIFASIIALSRVVLDYHFLGDVISGAYIGILGFHLAQKISKTNAS